MRGPARLPNVFTPLEHQGDRKEKQNQGKRRPIRYLGSEVF
jgi:hypothetical protein